MSTVLNPIVIPTIGVMLYFLLTPNNFESNQKFKILSLVFTVTYLIPLLILILFKKFKVTKNYEPNTIKERKIPIGLMIVLFYLLGRTTSNIGNLGLLFYATSLGLVLIYILFFFNIKASVHLLSLGLFAGFFMVLSTIYSQSYMLLIMIILLLSGILGSARLNLKAHTTKEIYIGFFIGLIAPLIINVML
jgi:membrane-associated HD superfamily phosphohydrolase